MRGLEACKGPAKEDLMGRMAYRDTVLGPVGLEVQRWVITRSSSERGESAETKGLRLGLPRTSGSVREQGVCNPILTRLRSSSITQSLPLWTYPISVIFPINRISPSPPPHPIPRRIQRPCQSPAPSPPIFSMWPLKLLEAPAPPPPPPQPTKNVTVHTSLPGIPRGM